MNEIPEIDPYFKSRLTEATRSIGGRKHCNFECKYYSLCPLQPMGIQTGNCELNQFPLTVQRTFINLFLEGREGLIYEMLVDIWKFRMNCNLEGNKTDAKEYLNILMKFHKEVYGAAAKIIAPKDIDIKIQEVGKTISNISKPKEIPYDTDILYDNDDEESLFQGDFAEKMIKVFKEHRAEDEEDDIRG